MRIAIVALSCPNGGMLHYASQLANALSETEEVFFFSPPKPELGEYLNPRVQLLASKRLSFPHRRERTFIRQLNPLIHLEHARRIRSLAPDVVHFVTDHPCNGILANLLAGLPKCFTHHDPSRHPGETSGVKEALTRWSIQKYDRVVAHGEALRQEMHEQGIPASKVKVIPHGDFGFLRRYAEGTPEDPMILFFGRFVTYKGMDVLLEAQAYLDSRLGDYTLCLAGEGPLPQAKMGPRVRLINRFITDQEVAKLFQQARVVVLPYLQASQSGILAIAFAFGKPVVVTDVGGLPEAVGYGKAGLVVPPGDPKALAEAIARLWHDPSLRTQLGNAGGALIERSIGWHHIARQHLEMYREIQKDPGSLHMLSQP